MRKKKTARTTKNKSSLNGEKIPADKAAAGFFWIISADYGES